MGPGVFLLIVGAILMFAVRADTEVLDIQTMGLILAIAGGALVWHAKDGATREREVTTVDDVSDPSRVVHTVHESVTEQDPYDHLHGELQGDAEHRRP